MGDVDTSTKVFEAIAMDLEWAGKLLRVSSFVEWADSVRALAAQRDALQKESRQHVLKNLQLLDHFALAAGFVLHQDVEKRPTVADIDTALDAFRERETQLHDNCRKLLEGFDEKVFVRNIEGDGESDWAMKLLPYMASLARIRQAMDVGQTAEEDTATTG